MPTPTDLQLVQAARDVLASTHPTNPVLVAVRSFAFAELSQAEHDVVLDREAKPRVLSLARTITREEQPT
jgi:tRNA(Ile2) C34 agmatinyltransferase TiaS